MGFQVLNGVDAAYEAMSKWYSSDTAIWEASAEGYSVLSGGQVVAGTNTGTVKVGAGVDQLAGATPWNVTYALTDNIACATYADATYPRWQLIEVDTAGVVRSNLGTAGASPLPPTPTVGRVVHAAIYIPAAATTVDASLILANGKAKIMDKRVLARSESTLICFSNIDVTIAPTTRVLAQIGTMTGTRNVTLPAANAVSAGTAITIVDVSGTTGANALLILAAGSDTVNGAAFALVASAYGSVTLISDGTSKWTQGITQIMSGGTGAVNATTAFDALSPGTTQGDVIYRNASNNVRLGAGTSGQSLVTGGASANPAWRPTVDVAAITASGTWTKPTNATWVRVIAIGSGGGGGGGRLGATGTARWGGGGGAGGNWIVEDFNAADLTSTVTVTIPAGGTAGVGRSGAVANGGSGGTPAAVTFGAFVSAAGGGGGGGGTTTTGIAGAASTDAIFPVPWYAIGSPAAGSSGGAGAGTSPAPGNNGQAGSPGAGAGGAGISSGNLNDIGNTGGGGGGYDRTNANKLVGGAGGASTGAAGSAGTASGTSPSSSRTGGSGGGSGASGTGTANTTGGGAGGAGGLWGGGGGGGAAGTSVTSTGTSGAGGVGAKGYVLVISYCGPTAHNP